LNQALQARRIDTLSAIETPEGITLGLRAAGPMPRALAWLIDAAIRVGALFVLSTAFAFLGQAGSGFFLVSMFLLLWFYTVFFEVLNQGRTPGKMAMKIRVVRANGTPVGWLASFQRNLLRTVDMLPFFYGFGLVASLIDSKGRRIGDWVADTLVVYIDPPIKVASLPHGPNVALPLPLSIDEQTAVVSFAERCALLTTERQVEIAEQLSELTGCKGMLAVNKLLGMAGTIVGRDPNTPPPPPPIYVGPQVARSAIDKQGPR
jgi:uncharacterized RDD family membrane protein YckC